MQESFHIHVNIFFVVGTTILRKLHVVDVFAIQLQCSHVIYCKCAANTTVCMQVGNLKKK